MALLSFGSFASELSSSDKKSFSFVVDGEYLDTVLQKTVVALAQDSASSIKETILLVQGGQLFVVGFTPDVMVEFYLDIATQVKGSGFVGINVPVLQGLIRKRKDLTFTYGSKDKNVITFKALKGVYSGELNVTDLDDTVLPLLNDKIAAFEVKSSIKKSIFRAIVDGVKKTSLKNVYNASQTILSFVVFDGGSGQLDVFSYDQWHLSTYRTHVLKTETDSFSLSFVPTLFDTFEKLISHKTQAKTPGDPIASGDLGLGMVKNSLILVGDGFRVMVPHLQSEPKDFDAPRQFLSKLTDHTASFVFNQRLLDSIVNLGSLLTVKGSQYQLTINTNGVYLSVKTSNGVAKDKIPIKNLVVEGDAETTIRFDPDLLKDLVKPLYKQDMTSSKMTFSTYDSCYRIDSVVLDGEVVKYELVMLCSVYSEND
jgi:hypothetical protein